MCVRPRRSEIHKTLYHIGFITFLPYCLCNVRVDCSVERIREVSLGLNPKLEIFEISCKTGEGIDQWSEWLLTQIQPQG